jgi:hypothetical protein
LACGHSSGATASRERFVIASASEAIQAEISRWIASSRPLLAMTARISLSGAASQDDGKLSLRGGKGQAPRDRFVIASASEAIQAEISRWIASSRPLLAMTARISENGFP